MRNSVQELEQELTSTCKPLHICVGPLSFQKQDAYVFELFAGKELDVAEESNQLQEQKNLPPMTEKSNAGRS